MVEWITWIVVITKQSWIKTCACRTSICPSSLKSQLACHTLWVSYLLYPTKGTRNQGIWKIPLINVGNSSVGIRQLLDQFIFAMEFSTLVRQCPYIEMSLGQCFNIYKLCVIIRSWSPKVQLSVNLFNTLKFGQWLDSSVMNTIIISIAWAFFAYIKFELNITHTVNGFHFLNCIFALVTIYCFTLFHNNNSFHLSFIWYCFEVLWIIAHRWAMVVT